MKYQITTDSSEQLHTLPAHLMGATASSDWVAQFDAIAVGHAQDGGVGQEVARPAGLGFQPAEEAGAVRKVGEEVAIVVLEPVVEGRRLTFLMACRMPIVSSLLMDKTAWECRATLGRASSILQ